MNLFHLRKEYLQKFKLFCTQEREHKWNGMPCNLYVPSPTFAIILPFHTTPILLSRYKSLFFKSVASTMDFFSVAKS